MPQEPKKRHSRQRQGKRRAAIKLSLKALVDCQNCGAMILPHTVCSKCGYYKGRAVIVKKTPNQSVQGKAKNKMEENEEKPEIEAVSEGKV
jgi:large subunit ribosomal protein L32